jgi:hypothetical protein
MSVWNNRGFTENELSRPAKLIVGLFLAVVLVAEAATATTNAVHGIVPRPWCSLLVGIVFFFFLLPKLHVVRHKRRISFGTTQMTEGQANSYRLGYLLMACGYLLTFR